MASDFKYVHLYTCYMTVDGDGYVLEASWIHRWRDKNTGREVGDTVVLFETIPYSLPLRMQVNLVYRLPADWSSLIQMKKLMRQVYRAWTGFLGAFEGSAIECHFG